MNNLLLPHNQLGCPVANGHGPCNHLCGGNWPGTKELNHERMRKLLSEGKITPHNLPCGPLVDQAFLFYEWLSEQPI